MQGLNELSKPKILLRHSSYIHSLTCLQQSYIRRLLATLMGPSNSSLNPLVSLPKVMALPPFRRTFKISSTRSIIKAITMVISVKIQGVRAVRDSSLQYLGNQDRCPEVSLHSQCPFSNTKTTSKMLGHTLGITITM